MIPTVFLAGAAGVIGRRLAPLLVADGWRVVGTTRRPDRAPLLRGMGVAPVIVDAFDADALRAAVLAARPEVVMHQLTDLPPGLDPARMAEALGRNARIRIDGTRNLVAASVAAGVARLVAQSIAFAYAPGTLPHAEDAPLAVDAAGSVGVTAQAVASLEAQVLGAPLAGIVLRFGRFYGPGTGAEAPRGAAPVHVDAAAHAARLACTRGGKGVYNVAEEDGTVDAGRARRLLGWSADWRPAG